MIRIREFLLDLLFGTSEKGILNNTEGNCSEKHDLPAEMGEIILELKKKTVITDNGVNYKALRKSKAFEKLQKVIYPCLRDFDPSTLTSSELKLVFWINLYNLLTIDAVLRYSVKRSVTEGWFGVIRFFRKAKYLVGGNRYSLEDIEHGILRANRGVPFFFGRQFRKNDPRIHCVLKQIDPRIHFALNCASRSCPPIAYYSAERIHAQLDLAAANFIDSETWMDKSGVALRISRIFKWYQKDFGMKDGVLEFLERYLQERDIRRLLIENFDYKTMIIFSPYDWHLNVLT